MHLSSRLPKKNYESVFNQEMLRSAQTNLEF
jgi:hypothetical protein